MDLTIVRSVTSAPASCRSTYVIGTHGGIFHQDDVVATALLCMLNRRERIIVVRTRDNDILKQCDICIDIGGGKYDHHQPGFNLKRPDGILYASAGLIWKDYGPQIVSEAISKLGLQEELSDSCSIIVDRIDAEVMKFVDAEDNGINLGAHSMSFITSFLPTWIDPEPDFEVAFESILITTISVLEKKIQEAISNVYAYETIMNRIKEPQYFTDFVLELPNQTIPWQETVCNYNAELSGYCVDFVIFPYPAGGWAAQSVPPSIEEKFKQRISFPKSWAGQTDNLAKISGVSGATFCHNGCFFVRATNKADVIQMCLIAMKHG